MLNTKDYTPIISQLTDLHIWQRDISYILIKKVADSSDDEKLLALLSNYVDKIEQLDEVLKKISVSAACSFEDEMFRKLIATKLGA